MIEKKFNISFVASLALREKQIQQNYRPIIAVHKWFARRPGTLFRSLLLSEFSEGELTHEFYRSQKFTGKRVADPFMGGGTPLLEANRMGFDSIGFDINPLAWWIVREQIEHLNLKDYRRQAAKLRTSLEKDMGDLYRTRCVIDGTPDVHAKYFLWVKTMECEGCGRSIDLFPGYLVAEDVRHPRNVIVCAQCGELTEVENREEPGKCRDCATALQLSGSVSHGVCTCPHCGKQHKIPGLRKSPFGHRLFAIEYTHPGCQKPHEGRFFKKPDADDLTRVETAINTLNRLRPEFIPDDPIPDGDETARLHRWGYRRYREMFNERQLLGLEKSCRLIRAVDDKRVRKALATNLSDLLRYQNMLCRYDTMALKSLDIFSVHGFPVGLVHVESNILGVANPSTGYPVGSGGWHNIIEKYSKAKEYCEAPFEIRHTAKGKETVPMVDEWIGEYRNGQRSPESRYVRVECGDSAFREIEPGSLDAVMTDPPYFGNVQYSELMDFCYVWLRKLMSDCVEFESSSTRRSAELTGNITAGRGLDHFTEGLGSVFLSMAKALKKGSPLAFTFHHNDIQAYHMIAVAILDAGLVCSGSIPCPAEMGASIHISGTQSSIIDTVFVCRSTGVVPRKWIIETPALLTALIIEELGKLEAGGVKPTEGDARCIAYGHLTRLAIWTVRHDWEIKQSVQQKLKRISNWIGSFCEVDEFLAGIRKVKSLVPRQTCYAALDEKETYGKDSDEVSF